MITIIILILIIPIALFFLTQTIFYFLNKIKTYKHIKILKILIYFIIIFVIICSVIFFLAFYIDSILDFFHLTLETKNILFLHSKDIVINLLINSISYLFIFFSFLIKNFKLKSYIKNPIFILIFSYMYSLNVSSIKIQNWDEEPNFDADSNSDENLYLNENNNLEEKTKLDTNNKLEELNKLYIKNNSINYPVNYQRKVKFKATTETRYYELSETEQLDKQQINREININMPQARLDGRAEKLEAKQLITQQERETDLEINPKQKGKETMNINTFPSSSNEISQSNLITNKMIDDTIIEESNSHLESNTVSISNSSINLLYKPIKSQSTQAIDKITVERYIESSDNNNDLNDSDI